MRRREFIALVGGAVAWPLGVRAQQPAKIPLIGYLALAGRGAPSYNSFRDGLHDLGYIEGQNILIHDRIAADGKIDRLPALAAELVQLKVDVIFAVATPAARAAQQATTSIPIVAPNMGDPVGDKLVGSLARPGGNITGSTFLGPELVPKRLELLKEALPAASRVAVLWHPAAFGERTMRNLLAEVDVAARLQRLEVQLMETREPVDIERVFAAISQADALLVLPSVMLFGERGRISVLAAKKRLPTISVGREFVELGGLISYGASLADLSRRGATYVDKILKGAKPADLPVEQPTKFELVINLKTAKALGLTLPPALLARADEVIE